MGTGGVFLRRARAKVVDSPTGFVWIVNGRLAASGWPASRAQVEWLGRKGINSVLTLTEDPLPQGWLRGDKMKSMHIPMKDHEPPETQTLAKAAEYVKGELDAGRTLLVHCLAGRGRTMCVIGAYKVLLGEKPEEVLVELRGIRPGAVERGQESALFHYASTIRTEPLSD